VYNSGLYDSATGESCVTEKVVDVTDDCPGANKDSRCVILFTRDRHGRIVQVARPYKGRKYGGVSIHFFVDGLDRVMRNSRDDTFGRLASNLGLAKTKLYSLIVAHAPAA
jgi:hypothetical protein